MRSPTPPRLLPMLAGGNGVPPDPSGYLFEPKLDGVRVIAYVDGDGFMLTNRKGGDITSHYPEVGGLAAAVGPHRAVIDGEVVAFNEKGLTSFQRLQRRMHVVQPSARLLAETPVVFATFDVLWLDGEPLVDRTQLERRRLLDGLAIKGAAWQTAPVLDATPDELVAAGRAAGLEGFMAKRQDAVYQPGRRSNAWWKIKLGRRREFVVGGWSIGQGSRQESIGSLALGVYDDAGQLRYVGQAGSGLSEDLIRQLQKLFAQIGVADPPFVNPPPPAFRLQYVQPLLVVEIAYSEVTEGGTLRQPSIKGLRTDLVAAEVVWDEEIAACFG